MKRHFFNCQNNVIIKLAIFQMLDLSQTIL